MTPFHLSLEVRSIDESAAFFEDVLKGRIVHRDPSGYVNIEWGGCQITLQPGDAYSHAPETLHFGANLEPDAFDALAAHIMLHGKARVVAAPMVVDPNKPIERKKMYVREPSGYLIELKSYRHRQP